MESIDMKAIPLKNVLDFSKHGQYTTEQNKHILSQAINTRNVENLEEVEQKADELVFYMSALKELVQHEGLAANHETKVLYDYIAKLEYYVSLFATDSNGKSIFRKSHMSAIKEFGNADRSAL
ncbi:hypothetical protein GW750_04110 [bacterium]|nr:hypothetical protein [bacterium]